LLRATKKKKKKQRAMDGRPPRSHRPSATSHTHNTPQSGQRGAAAVLARDLQPRLADLVRVSQQLDGAWRMHAVREAGGGGSGRDLWKR
jgi:hypothetical protein